MSLLVVQIPHRPRLGSHSAVGAAATDYPYVLSGDGQTVLAQGQCVAALLPQADTVVAVLAATDLAWHQITLPRAPAARLRAALAGVLEEALLDDLSATHLALPAKAVAGEPCWVLAVHRGWLVAELAALEANKLFVDRVVPAAWPDDPPLAHVDSAPGPDGGEAVLTLTWSDAQGVNSLPLGGLARSLLPQPLPEGTRLTATPAAATPAEQWLGRPVEVLTVADGLLQSARSPWNLRQFELARRTRGSRALTDALKQFLSPAWRPARWGLVALLLVQLAGLNLWAWQQRQAVDNKRQAMVRLLQQEFPQVRAVLDAPLQLQREVQRLRAQAGKAGEDDLESLLQVAAAAWPADRPPAENLRFEPGRLSLSGAGWRPDQVAQFRDALQPAGWLLETVDNQLNLRRAPPPTGGRL